MDARILSWGRQFSPSLKLNQYLDADLNLNFNLSSDLNEFEFEMIG